jgi:hypothetical protein
VCRSKALWRLRCFSIAVAGVGERELRPKPKFFAPLLSPPASPELARSQEAPVGSGSSLPERCLAMSEQRGFRQWLRLSSAIRGVCRATLEASASRLDEVEAALDDYQRAGYQLGITTQFALARQSHTPCNRCVRFATTVASGPATLATKRTLLLNLGRTCTGWIAPACGWRTYSITSWARPAIAGSRDKFVQQSRRTFRNDPRSVRRASGQLTPELRLRRAICQSPTKYGFPWRCWYLSPLEVSCLPAVRATQQTVVRYSSCWSGASSQRRRRICLEGRRKCRRAVNPVSSSLLRSGHDAMLMQAGALGTPLAQGAPVALLPPRH